MELDPQDDAGLLRRIGAGDVAAFAALVRRHQATVLAVALAITGDRGLAEDVTQEALVKAWRHVGRVREPDRVGAWLASIARSLARDRVRRDGRRTRLGGRNPDPHGDRAALAPSALELAVAREDEVLLVEVVTALPAGYREPLLLHYLGGLSLTDIGAALALGEDAVKQRLSRGRRALRDALGARDVAEPRFARAALALVPGAAFTDRVVAAATAPPPPPVSGKEAFMRAHPFLAAAVTGAVVVGGGLAVARSTSSSSPAGTGSSVVPGAAAGQSAPSSLTRAATPPQARPGAATAGVIAADRAVVAVDGYPSHRDALLAAIRGARRQAATPAAADAPVVEPKTMIYDFAGETLTAGAEPAPAEPAPASSTTLDKRAIRAALVEVRPAILACYEAGLLRHPGARGTLTLSLTIEGEPGVGGVVSAAEVLPAATTLVDDDLAACAVDVVLGVELPAPVAGTVVTVNYPYVLEPG